MKKMTLKEIFGLDEGDVIDFPKKPAAKAPDLKTALSQNSAYAPKKKSFDTFRSEGKAVLAQCPSLKNTSGEDILDDVSKWVDYIAGQGFDWFEKQGDEAKDREFEKQFHVVLSKFEEFLKETEKLDKMVPDEAF